MPSSIDISLIYSLALFLKKSPATSVAALARSFPREERLLLALALLAIAIATKPAKILFFHMPSYICVNPNKIIAMPIKAMPIPKPFEDFSLLSLITNSEGFDGLNKMSAVSPSL